MEAACCLTGLRSPWDDHDMEGITFRPGQRPRAGRTYLSVRRLRVAVVWSLSFATAGLGTAQTGIPPRRTVWDGAYTEAQAVRGTAAYGQSCAGCHALAAEGKAPLVGEAFWKSFAQKTVGDLLEFVRTNM